MKSTRPYIFAVSGYKHVGKTTLITKLIKKLRSLGYTVATIKHDGHDFIADSEGTDSYKHREAGADLNIVFSAHKMMMIAKPLDIQAMIALAQDHDFIILEGFKTSPYPKIEIIKEDGEASVVDPTTRLALVSDIAMTNEQYISWNDIDKLIEIILESRERQDGIN
ncbi:MAG: molybdopterin-guanine dinucleotide biosynthesis protein B [Erysipelotrichaceae bacterium]|nr:molybdopterin-guanine dinucleotide biosynthesis protein B [Erysipelotrichaceae bacterium]MDY5251164.1 molybdopterin-guanine dinucleotide biosynthesis protein B [Erysipelotrichaceae bacterium]